jgi:uncharacterized BrkB/YihY/UPF0761 family membrane protein
MGMKIKYVLQEIGIVIFLIILTIFTAIQSENFRKSQTFFALETVIIVAVFVAIGSEVISIGWSVYDTVTNFLKERKEKKKQNEENKFTKMESKSRA